jgi:Tfp pilus assembly protein FimT
MSASRFTRRRLRAFVEDSSPGFTLVELMAYAAVVVTTAAFLVPFTRSALNSMNLTSDARNVSSATQLAKMRAAADFTKARIYVELAAGTFRVQRWRKVAPVGWVEEGQVAPLSPTVGFGFAGLSTPPPNTQAAIGQAPPCLDNANQPIAATACIIFNSRGVPVDTANTPTANGAFYLSDGATVFAITTSSGGLVRVWRSNTGGATWAAQ